MSLPRAHGLTATVQKISGFNFEKTNWYGRAKRSETALAPKCKVMSSQCYHVIHKGPKSGSAHSLAATNLSVSFLFTCYSSRKLARASSLYASVFGLSGHKWYRSVCSVVIRHIVVFQLQANETRLNNIHDKLVKQLVEHVASVTWVFQRFRIHYPELWLAFCCL